MGITSTFVSRYGYTDDSAKRDWDDLGVRVGKDNGISIGRSAFRAARESNIDGSMLGCGCWSSILERVSRMLQVPKDADETIPTAARGFSALEDAYNVESLFFRQCIEGYRTTRPQPNESDALDGHRIEISKSARYHVRMGVEVKLLMLGDNLLFGSRPEDL